MLNPLVYDRDLMTKSRVLVLGAGGYIGRRVLAALESGDWAIPIAATGNAVFPDDSIEHIQLDTTDATAIKASLRDAEAVVNCAAGSADDIVFGARALFSAIRGMPNPPRVVHLSSMAVYGEATGVVSESNLAAGKLSKYGSAKVAAEREAAGLPSTVILRPGIVYGPGSSQWSGRIAQWLVRHRIGDLGRYGDGFSNLVYIDDTVEAIMLALRSPEAAGKVFNLSLPEPPTWNEYFMRYAKALGAVPVSRITRRRLTLETKLLAPPLKIAQILAKPISRSYSGWIPEPIPPSVVQLFGQEIRLDVRAAQDILGLRWTALPEGLQAAAQFYGR